MSDMIERVARALYESPRSDMLAKHDHAFPVPDWGNAHLAVRDDWRIKACAAIEAMREPTKALVKLWFLEMQRQGAVFDDLSPPDYPVDLWEGLIDAALPAPLIGEEK